MPSKSKYPLTIITLLLLILNLLDYATTSYGLSTKNLIELNPLLNAENLTEIKLYTMCMQTSTLILCFFAERKYDLKLYMPRVYNLLLYVGLFVVGQYVFTVVNNLIVILIN